MESSRTKSICLPFQGEDHYLTCLADPRAFRLYLSSLHLSHPELFPTSFDKGFALHDLRFSKKQNLFLRRIRLRATKQRLLVRPSFLLPYMVARTEQAEKALYLRQWGVPFEALAYVFGKNPMFWYRACLALGRPSLVGTTVKNPQKLPEHLVADEKHTWLVGQRVFVPTTAAKGCFLGASVALSADTAALTAAYGEFAQEARELDRVYQPKTVCTDGWDATQAAWTRLFPEICLVLCFLHSVLKIVERCVRNRGLRKLLLDKAWSAYAAVRQNQFSQRLRRFREWARRYLGPGVVRETVLSLCRKGPRFARGYRYVGAYRTSNEVDRLMSYQDRLLYMMRYFHGKTESARLAVRGMALLWNFHPYGARQRREEPQRRSPFCDLNGFEYHQNWLHNLLIASSMGGRKR